MVINLEEQGIKLILTAILKVYAVFTVLTGVLMFAIPVTKKNEYQNNVEHQRFYGTGEGVDQAVLLDDPSLAALARHDIIVNAEHTIDVAYYSLHRDYSAEALFGALIEAADRGVKVRILLDGIAHSMTGSLRAVRYAIMHHKNMELKLYEPFNLLQPWTWNNRFHDKYIVVDDCWGIIGGRNVGIRYFDPNSKRPVNDRDVLIINQGGEDGQASVIHQFKDYFDLQWNCPYARKARVPLRLMAQRLISGGREKTEQVIREARHIARTYYDEKFDWQSLALPTRKITLIHNPVKRMNKEPRILMELAALMDKAKERILIQSPYVIPTRAMLSCFSDEPFQAEIVVLTNHPASRSNSNIFAVAGYLNKKRLVESSADVLYEYYNSGSIHAKTFVFDQTLSMVGSYNFDARSSFLSTESMVVIDSPEFAQVLEESVTETIREGLTDQTMPLVKQVIVGFFRVILFFFDFLL